MRHPFRIVPAGDAALIVMFDEVMFDEPRGDRRHERALAAAAAIASARFPDVLDVVPTADTVGVFFDPVHMDPAHLIPLLSQAVAGASASRQPAARTIQVPVCYGGAFGPDLAEVAVFARTDEAAVVAMHTAATYHVRMLGFAPGFAYLGEVPPRIAMPRRSEPRTRVPAGSVGIAGGQTAVYPFDTPGGWRLVGRTPLRPCDFSRSEPFLFAPGDLVRFVSIDADRFDRLAREPAEAGA